MPLSERIKSLLNMPGKPELSAADLQTLAIDWARLLADLPSDCIHAAADEWMTKQRWRPTIADIRALAIEKRENAELRQKPRIQYRKHEPYDDKPWTAEERARIGFMFQAIREMLAEATTGMEPDAANGWAKMRMKQLCRENGVAMPD